MARGDHDDDIRLPERAVLLHIGPHKTGTTALQGALRLARPTLAEHGVVYAGTGRSHMFAALAVTGGKGLVGDGPMPMRRWRRLVRQVKAASDARVVVSSEFFDDASDETAKQIVEDLGGERVHVVITLRPLAKILPSAWQQYVRNRLRTSYGDWLDAMLRKPPYIQPTTTFWKRHHHDVLVERWAAAAGPSNVTVVVVDENDRSMLLNTFERMLGVPQGLLVPETGWMNRSLSLGEIELIRQLNIEFKRRRWPDPTYKRFVPFGVALQLQAGRRPAPDEPQIVTPRWALERVAEIGAAAAVRIEKSGVRIVGDISTLGSGPRGDEPDDVAADVSVLPVDVACQAVLGAVIVGSGGTVGEETDLRELQPTGDDRPVREVSTLQLVGVLGRRLRKRLHLEREPTEDGARPGSVAGQRRGAP